MVGDIAHSRVVRSNIHLLTKLGARVRVAGPRTMVPSGIESLGVEVHYSLEDAIRGADVVMMLRLQLERQTRFLFPSVREYSRLFGLTAEKLELAAPDAIVLHPGPMNRNVEIASDVADGPRSLILAQVGHGVAVRMAALYLLARARESAA
jgi:aspartate carbamoyltransferase catalytic subunit